MRMRYLLPLFLLMISQLGSFAQAPPSVMVWTLADNAMQSHDWITASRVWENILAKTDWPYTPHTRDEAQMALADAWRQLRRYDDAEKQYRTLLANHLEDTLAISILVQLTDIAKARGQLATNIDWTLHLLLDDPSASSSRVRWYADQAVKELNIASSLVTGVAAYANTHPAHPAYADLLWLQVSLLYQSGNSPQARSLAQQVLATAGCPSSEVMVWLGKDLIAQGKVAAGGQMLENVHRLFPDVYAHTYALTAYRQAENVELLGQLLVRLLRPGSDISSETLDSAFWLFQLALAGNDLATAKLWCDRVNATVPEHVIASKMRKLLKEAQTKTTDTH